MCSDNIIMELSMRSLSKTYTKEKLAANQTPPNSPPNSPPTSPTKSPSQSSQSSQSKLGITHSDFFSRDASIENAENYRLKKNLKYSTDLMNEEEVTRSLRNRSFTLAFLPSPESFSHSESPSNSTESTNSNESSSSKSKNGKEEETSTKSNKKHKKHKKKKKNNDRKKTVVLDINTGVDDDVEGSNSEKRAKRDNMFKKHIGRVGAALFSTWETFVYGPEKSFVANSRSRSKSVVRHK